MKYPEVLVNEMRIRNYSRKTIKAYVYWNDVFLKFAGKEPLLVTHNDINCFLLHIEQKGMEANTRHLAVSALHFYYSQVLRRRFEWKYPKTPEQLPIVLTREEILKMIAATSNPKHRLLIELLYSSGLRVGEAVKIRTEDISSEQKTAIIRQGKGAKDRLVILSEKFIADFIAFQQSKKDKSPYVFPSATGQPHISIRTAQKIIENSAKKACIRKRVYCHALRASFATHLLDRGTGMAHIQKLMGHNRVSTTQGYIRLSTAGLKGIRSPMDE